MQGVVGRRTSNDKDVIRWYSRGRGPADVMKDREQGKIGQCFQGAVAPWTRNDKDMIRRHSRGRGPADVRKDREQGTLRKCMSSGCGSGAEQRTKRHSV